MGWLFYTDKRLQGHAQERAEIERICTNDNEDMTQIPVRLSKVGSTWYVAVTTTPKPGRTVSQSSFVPDADGSYTFGAVFLVSYDQGCFGYKDMVETMGPAEARAPLDLISLLSELTDPDCYAHGWRKKCADWAAIPSYKEGDEIRLREPVKLTSGATVQTVRRTHYMRRGRKMTCYADVKNGQLVRLSRECFAGSELITDALSAGSDILAEFYARTRIG